MCTSSTEMNCGRALSACLSSQICDTSEVKSHTTHAQRVPAIDNWQRLQHAVFDPTLAMVSDWRHWLHETGINRVGLISSLVYILVNMHVC